MSQQGGGAVKRRGKISASGDVLWITFPFSKKRFERIKRLSRASYNKEQRRWELPLLDLPKIQSLEQFRPHEILYDLEEPRTSSRLALLQNDLTAALERLQENPFFVSQARSRDRNLARRSESAGPVSRASCETAPLF